MKCVTFLRKFVTMETVHKIIEHSISRKKKGELIFPTDFRGMGTEAAIKQTLSRLVKKGKIKRAAHGIYYIPKFDPLFGELPPGGETIAKMLAQKEKVRILPAGANALNRLGLSTQVPTNLVYITDGPPRKIKVGKLVITFKTTSPKRLSRIGKISSLVILALEDLALERISMDNATRIRDLLKKEDPKHLRHDLALASARINDYIFILLQTE